MSILSKKSSELTAPRQFRERIVAGSRLRARLIARTIWNHRCANDWLQLALMMGGRQSCFPGKDSRLGKKQSSYVIRCAKITWHYAPACCRGCCEYLTTIFVPERNAWRSLKQVGFSNRRAAQNRNEWLFFFGVTWEVKFIGETKNAALISSI